MAMRPFTNTRAFSLGVNVTATWFHSPATISAVPDAFVAQSGSISPARPATHLRGRIVSASVPSAGRQSSDISEQMSRFANGRNPTFVCCEAASNRRTVSPACFSAGRNHASAVPSFIG